MNETTHFDQAAAKWGTATAEILAFGYEMMLAIDTEGRTIREMSIKLCGNEGLEDRIGRWVQAARWEEAMRPHPLYEDAMDRLTPSHFTELYRAATDESTADALALMEQTFIRDNTDSQAITAVRPVSWLQSKRKRTEPSTAEIWARVFNVAEKALPEAYSVLERLGRDATHADRRRVRVLKLAQAVFAEVSL